MTNTLLDAFDLVAHSEQLLFRLDAAAAELSKKQGLKDEKAWLDQARARVSTARDGVNDLLTRVLRLPEMDPVREDHARLLQNVAVDAVEKLHAGITFAAGSRAPLLEALYGKLKLPVLRRCDREDFEKFCADFEKRLGTGYARRMFGEESFQIVAPTLTSLQQAFNTWRGVFSSEPLDDAAAQGLRDELDAVSRRLELPCKQARLLAEAALAPLRDLLENSGVSSKPKKRVKVPGEDASPLDEDPVDPHAPNEAELAELSAPVVEEEEAAAPVEPEPEPEPVVEKPRRSRKDKSAEA